MPCCRLATPCLLTILLTVATTVLAAQTPFGEDYWSQRLEDPRFERLQQRLQSEQAAARGTVSEVLTVGTGDCDYSDLGAALFEAMDNAEIRVSTGTYTGNFVIMDGRNLTIRGGYASCSDSEPSGTTTLDAQNAGTVLDIFHETAASTVSLENLRLVNGSSSNLGGGLQVEGDHWVFLTNVEVADSTTTGHGGGIQVRGHNDTMVVLEEVIISGNSADKGGGIGCIADGGMPGLLIQSASIAQNEAAFGGGIDAEGCFVENHAGGLFQGVFNNLATESGGGISAREGSLVGIIGGAAGLYIQGDPEESAYVYSNQADSMGGGILAIGGSDVTVLDGVVSGNSATFGGGVMVHTGAYFEMIRGDGTDCQRYDSSFSPAPCSRLEGNSASDYGGAIALTNELSSALIAQTYIEGNQAQNHGSVLYTLGPDVRFEGNVIHDNPGVHLFDIRQGAQFELDWSTIADNPSASVSESLTRVYGSSVATTTVRMRGSIFADGSRPLVNRNEAVAPVSVVADCLIAHETDSVPEATNSIVADPLFVNPSDDDYHIQPGSPAVDFCGGTAAPVEDDIDEQPRGFGGTTTTPFDAGADEFLPDGLFSDRFEQ